VQFSRLRLSGFKSFIDPTELWIQPGLTGVVGPNGCGKSNLVDALRWVMGETSAKQMRGGEMDDVIFAGTTVRPARNIAEVTLHLDNTRREAPAMFNHADELEVTRRIDRGAGSSYFVNGKEVRARDVHLLFADAATGAHSTAVVSQGHIGDLIKAKPAERRAILEEAAGITGLHARRHEAELRLRAAEANLARLDDVLVTLEAQLGALKRQARQAARYRRIGDLIRRAEAILLHLRWNEATAAIAAARTRLSKAHALVTELAANAGSAAAGQADAAAVLPDLRRDEAEAAAALQRLVIERETLDAEEARIEKARQDCEDRVEETGADMERERQLAADATETLRRITEDEAAVTAAMDGEGEAIAAAARGVAEASDEVGAAEAELTRRTEETAALEARRAALLRRIADCETRLSRLAQREGEIARQTEEVRALAVDEGAMAAAVRVLAAAEDKLQAARARIDAAEQALFAAQGSESAERDHSRAAEGEHTRLAAEAEALSRLLDNGADETLPPVIDELTVASGYEVALGAALGDDLSAPADARAPIRWQALEALPHPAPLPDGAEPLSRHVKAPASLGRRLSQIGVVADERQAEALQRRLAQGQRLVTHAGGLWRWDGFTVRAGAATAAAARLSQRNRLGEIRPALGAAQQRLREARAAFEAASQAARTAAQGLRDRQEDSRRAEAEVEAARKAHAELANRAEAHRSRQAALAQAAEAIAADRAEADGDLEDARRALDELPDAAELRLHAARAREALNERRATLTRCQSDHDHLLREAKARAERLALCAAERASWQVRADGAARKLAELELRLKGLEEERASLALRPKEIAERRSRLEQAIVAAESRRGEAAGLLAAAEARLREADQKLKQEEAKLAEAREDRVRAEAHLEQAEQAMHAVEDRIEEKLQCRPEEALSAGSIPEGEILPEIAAVETRLERLLRERDNMGPVNLRAEVESAEIETQMTTLRTEREDLISAISRLRQGISNLNREGRERLLAAFNEVDSHFQQLFVRLVGGGRAHMKLSDAEDPLEAGLEIFASPPGKRLQVLSLLSGGEQALTALALMFAVFLTNPAPICVLDEVDAPLDDSNVDRFCALVEEIAHSSATRFLLITHHRITMARMHRLFGVTMVEQGVSQLVSVDLADAERLRATA
jgi:chromosome segregation protein